MVDAARNQPGERGAALIIMLIFLFPILWLFAYAIDVPSWQRYAQLLQRTVDAASLASATTLKPNTSGWTDSAQQKAAWQASKRAGIAMIRGNAFSAMADDLRGWKVPTPSCALAERDPFEPANSGYACNAFRVGDLAIAIRRGLYREAGHDFRSLERGDGLVDSNGICSDPLCPASLPAYKLATAVEVTISYNESGRAFSQLFRRSGPIRLERHSISAVDTRVQP